MLGKVIKDQIRLVKTLTKFGITWGPTAASWGVVGVAGLLYAIQPRFLFKRLPIIGDNYLTQKDIENMKAEQKK